METFCSRRTESVSGDVIAGHGMTAFIEAAQAAGCKTSNGSDMVEAVQALMADFMLHPTDEATR